MAIRGHENYIVGRSLGITRPPKILASKLISSVTLILLPAKAEPISLCKSGLIKQFPTDLWHLRNLGFVVFRQNLELEG
jgi:hypothetical protein